MVKTTTLAARRNPNAFHNFIYRPSARWRPARHTESRRQRGHPGSGIVQVLRGAAAVALCLAWAQALLLARVPVLLLAP